MRVKDEQWQPAIEAFLSGNRSALVVDPGRERDAVRIMRTSGRHLYNVTVVQPEHLRDMIGRKPEAHSVASLIDGEHPVALAFLRRCLGRLRQVDTEQELEKYDRSLSRDAMLSLNGGTKRIALADKGDWALGARPACGDIVFLREEMVLLMRAEESAKQQLRRSRLADEAVRRVKSEATGDLFDAALTALAAASAELDAIGDVAEADLPQHLKGLAEKMRKVKQQAAEAEKLHAQLSTTVGSVAAELAATVTSLARARGQMAASEQRLAAARAHRDFSEELGVALYT